MKRTLSLKRETLTELSSDELVHVAGGAAPPTSPLVDCVNGHNSDMVCYTREAGPSRCFCPTEV